MIIQYSLCLRNVEWMSIYYRAKCKLSREVSSFSPVCSLYSPPGHHPHLQPTLIVAESALSSQTQPQNCWLWRGSGYWWLDGWSTGWLVGFMAGWSMTVWLAGQIKGWLTCWSPAGWSGRWLTGWVWLSDWLVIWMADWSMAVRLDRLEGVARSAGLLFLGAKEELFILLWSTFW